MVGMGAGVEGGWLIVAIMGNIDKIVRQDEGSKGAAFAIFPRS